MPDPKDTTTPGPDASKEGGAGSGSPAVKKDPYNGMIPIIVKKPFIFTASIPIETSDGVVRYTQRERQFHKGTHLLNPNDPEDSAFLNHPYYTGSYCDAHVESPDETHERAKAEEAKAAEARSAADNAIAQAQAAQAMARAAGARSQVDEEAAKDELNTPLNVLRGGAKVPGFQRGGATKK